jgi:predicted Rossmann-fold nucleotide-binding protein
MLEIETLAALEEHLRRGAGLRDVVLQCLDLREMTARLRQLPLAGAFFLGCRLEPEALAYAIGAGALVFPELPGLPYSPYRAALYSPDELYQGFDPSREESYKDTLDRRVYEHWVREGRASPASIVEALAQRLHDHAITDALEELLVGRRVVAVMGGHSMQRGSPDYLAVAEISRSLSRKGFLLVSGGGPGAMEATHFGAYFAERPDAELEAGIATLALAPGYKDEGWLKRAFEVRRAYPPGRGAAVSIGVPTWHYGHEPPNPFPSHIAKYFANSVREEGLLTIATGGVIFAPGSAGTIQEIFQDACQNHYNTAGVVSPMVFYGEGFWKWQKPVFPLLAQLAAGNEYARYLAITDSKAQVIQAIESFAESRGRAG